MGSKMLLSIPTIILTNMRIIVRQVGSLTWLTIVVNGVEHDLGTYSKAELADVLEQFKDTVNTLEFRMNHE